MATVRACDLCSRIQPLHCAGDYWICADCECSLIEKEAGEEE